MKTKLQIIRVFISLFLIPFTLLASTESADTSKIIFPRPFAVAIDDLGWNIGNNEGYDDLQGPYRIGIERKMDINDYKCIVSVAKELNVRLQALFIMGEMDRENVLKKYPTTNPNGVNWDNSLNVSKEQLEIMEFVKKNSAYLEFGLHGVLHEYWTEENKRSRAEWYNIDDNHPWPEEEIDNHIRCFKEILAQYGLSEEEGHSFPESFVPCAYSYHWNPEGEVSTGLVLKKEGVKYANTLFQEVSELNPPKGPNAGGIDHGLLVINRINYGNYWFAYSALPTVPVYEQESDIIETHWANWLAQDDFLQNATNKKWIEYFRMVQQQDDRYIAKNTEQFYSQWLYKKYTLVTDKGNGKVKIDNTKMPTSVYKNNLLGNMVLKVKLNEKEHISDASFGDGEIAACFEDQGFGFIYLPLLEQREYELEYTIGKEIMPNCILNDGTYNVYNFKSGKKKTFIKLRVYGKQKIKIRTPKSPVRIKVSNKNVQLLQQDYNEEQKTLILEMDALDIQGETTEIELFFK
jgi:hypothetical protein